MYSDGHPIVLTTGRGVPERSRMVRRTHAVGEDDPTGREPIWGRAARTLFRMVRTSRKPPTGKRLEVCSHTTKCRKSLGAALPVLTDRDEIRQLHDYGT